MNVPSIRALFAIAALYDGLLGTLFVIAPSWVFTRYEVTPPNHLGYVQFPAALLIIFALMFLNIAQESPQTCTANPLRHPLEGRVLQRHVHLLAECRYPLDLEAFRNY